MAGTTVLAYLNEHGEIAFVGSEKKKDADLFLLQQIRDRGFRQIFIDAPLSLPGVYTQPERYGDYFYREGDKAMKAMSPMFLGGLTARAMRLKASLSEEGIECFEIYPGALARQLELQQWNYKKQLEHLPAVVQQLSKVLAFPLASSALQSWHQLDALLAFHIGWRYLHQQHQCYGAADEGQIIV